jgi:hypothetical protein
VFASTFTSAPPADALVVTNATLDTTQPPPDNPGWNNVTVGANTRNFTYLGNGWALSASHVGPGPDDPASLRQLTFSPGTYTVIAGQNYLVPNPTGMGLSTNTDLRLVRLDGDPGLPSLTIASTSLTNSDLGTAKANVTIIGNGRTIAPTKTYWDSNFAETTAPGTYSGYYAGTDFTKRWGKNQIANEEPLFNQGDSDLRGDVQLDIGSTTTDVISMFTRFDDDGSAYEAQAVDRDSGSAVFRKNGSQWELIGVVNTIFTFTNQPSPTAVYGDYTSFADLTFYRNQILSIMNSHPGYSIMGDVNLDGVVSGDGTGPAATDDVTAFIQGWNSHQAIGNVESWKKGDLNLDGVTDVNDFFLMRSALATSGLNVGASTLSALFSHGAVPEPSTMALAAGAITLILCRRKSRLS